MAVRRERADAQIIWLAGINNQNFIMKDEETGSWWQQVSGEAIQGPLKGKKLNAVFNDEISFAIWKRENPQGRVLNPNETVASKYSPANWEEGILKLPHRDLRRRAGRFGHTEFDSTASKRTALRVPIRSKLSRKNV